MKNQKKPAIALSLLVLAFLNFQGISKPVTATTLRQDEVPASNCIANILRVYYSGYTADNTLYVKNKETKEIQAQVKDEGVYTFELRSQGGEYEIMANTCPPKAECWEPQYKVLKTIKLDAGEHKTISL